MSVRARARRSQNPLALRLSDGYLGHVGGDGAAPSYLPFMTVDSAILDTTEPSGPNGYAPASRNGHGARPKVVLVCSPGGHLQQMLALEPAWENFDCTWATLNAADVDHLLEGRRLLKGHGPTNRHIPNFILNLGFAWRTLRATKAEAVLSTGAGLSVPFFIVGKLFGLRLVYVESLTRIESLSLSGKLIYLLADAFFVQWPQQTRRRRARYRGSVL